MIRQTQIPGIGGVLVGELIVDLFAGGGGASAGIEAALGRSPDIAINHDPHAVRMHEANHPATKHYCESVYDVDPRTATGGQAVGLLWLSPDCRHFSSAKGSAPVSESVRALAWIGLRWVKHARPRVVCLENVPEFQTWGPLHRTHSEGCTGKHLRPTHKSNGQPIEYSDGLAYGCKSKCRFGSPIKERKGETFRAFVREFERYGYTVDRRVIICADHGAPTTRKRLFFVARCDGDTIDWEAPSHTKLGNPKPWRTAAECIDWSIPCPSIFDRKKPLAPATCRRIARGIARYVLQGKPFIVQVAHGDHVKRPGDRVTGLDQPMGVVTKINSHALAVPTLIQTGYGEREGQAPRSLDLNKPLGTVVAGAAKHALVAAFLAKHNGKTTGQPVSEPLHTVTGKDTKRVIAAHLTRFNENAIGGQLNQPLGTVMAGAASHGLVASNLIQIGARHEGGSQPVDQPMNTLLTTERFALVAAFLVQYYSQGSQDQPLDEPMATVVTRARHGLVVVTIEGEEYALADIGMRMLQPRELANAQGFDPGYILTGTKAQQIARIGNSVCPPVAAAIVRANLGPQRSRVAAA